MKSYSELIRRLINTTPAIVGGYKALEKIRALPEVESIDTEEGVIQLTDGTVIRFVYVEDE